jgi:hypothetical protein
MIAPKTQNGPGGSRHSRQGQNDHKAAEDTPTIARRTDERHAPAQTPIARFMLVHEHRPGRRTSDAIPLDHCPVCGYQSAHKTTWPPQETLWKSCTACGHRDEFAVIEIKAGSRRRRVA